MDPQSPYFSAPPPDSGPAAKPPPMSINVALRILQHVEVVAHAPFRPVGCEKALNLAYCTALDAVNRYVAGGGELPPREDER